MSPRVELWLTVAICALGAAYFGWKAWADTGTGRLTNTAFLIVGAVFAHRAINDVREKIRRQDADDED